MTSFRPCCQARARRDKGSVITNPSVDRKPHVILAEDDADLRAALIDVLRALGTEVEAVVDGGRFLVSVASQYNDGRTPKQVDLIVTDVRMPVCSGLDILDGIRAARWTTPVIIMTGLTTPMVHAKAAKLGATLLLKPLDLKTFEATVLDLLASRDSLAIDAVASDSAPRSSLRRESTR